MKRLLLTSASLLALMAAAPAASAATVTFGFTGEIVNLSSPWRPGRTQIIAFGAQGGDGNISDGTGAVGGKAPRSQGDFEFTAGEMLGDCGRGRRARRATRTAAEAAGEAALSSGRGNPLLVVAGGGGGAGDRGD